MKSLKDPRSASSIFLVPAKELQPHISIHTPERPPRWPWPWTWEFGLETTVCFVKPQHLQPLLWTRYPWPYKSHVLTSIALIDGALGGWLGSRDSNGLMINKRPEGPFPLPPCEDTVTRHHLWGGPSQICWDFDLGLPSLQHCEQ
jgi:hypothetical protein